MKNMAKKKSKKYVVDQNNINKTEKPLLLRINFYIGVYALLLMTDSLYFMPFDHLKNFTLMDGVSSLIEAFALFWFFMANARSAYFKNKVARFLVAGFITSVFTLNICGIFGVRYPVLYSLLKDNLIFCYLLPLIMAIVSTRVPLNVKVRFNFGVGLSAAVLSIILLIQSLFLHHDLWIFSVDRFHWAMTNSWVVLVAGVISVFLNPFDSEAYHKYLIDLRLERARRMSDSDRGRSYEYVEPVEEEDEIPPNYRDYASEKMLIDWQQGKYRDSQEFINDFHNTDGKGSKSDF
jgi:hypothetical protein